MLPKMRILDPAGRAYKGNNEGEQSFVHWEINDRRVGRVAE